jgi:hypothetical protein
VPWHSSIFGFILLGSAPLPVPSGGGAAAGAVGYRLAGGRAPSRGRSRTAASGWPAHPREGHGGHHPHANPLAPGRRETGIRPGAFPDAGLGDNSVGEGWPACTPLPVAPSATGGQDAKSPRGCSPRQRRSTKLEGLGADKAGTAYQRGAQSNSRAKKEFTPRTAHLLPGTGRRDFRAARRTLRPAIIRTR